MLIPAIILGAVFLGVVFTYVLRYLLSRVIRPAVWFDDNNEKHSFNISSHSQDNPNIKYDLIVLGGNAVTSEEIIERGYPLKCQYQEPADAAKRLYSDFTLRSADATLRSADATYYHPSYATSAYTLSNEVVDYALTVHKKNRKLIIAGISLGGGIAAQAVLKLKSHGINADYIGIRTFSSIGQVIPHIFGITSLPTILPNIFNGILSSFGGWDLNTRQAIQKIVEIDQNKLETEKTKIFIAGYKSDSVLGQRGSLANCTFSKKQISVVAVGENNREISDHNRSVVIA